MDRFIADLRRYSHQLREEPWTAFGGVTLCYSRDNDRRRRVHDVDGEGDLPDVLRCDRVLLAHWRNFVKALQSFDDANASNDDRQCNKSSEERDNDLERRREKREGEGWWLSKVELTPRIIGMLEPVLVARRSMRTLILDNNEFEGSRGVVFLCNLLENIPCIKRVSFHNNALGDIENVTRFCEVIKEHPSLEHLTLESVELEGDEDTLSLILDASQKLECLGLDGNEFRSCRAAGLITNFLTNNDVIKIMYLRDNRFGNHTADIFASSLKNYVSENLRFIDLGGNSFTQTGKETIHDVLFDTSSLNNALESNHTTVVYFDEPETKDRLRAINSGGTPSQNLHRKVYSLLFASAHDGSKLNQLLEGIPLGLMPDVLGYLLDYYPDDIPRGMRRHVLATSQDKNDTDIEDVFSAPTVTFTIMFQVLRSWNLPQLYAHL